MNTIGRASKRTLVLAATAALLGCPADWVVPMPPLTLSGRLLHLEPGAEPVRVRIAIPNIHFTASIARDWSRTPRAIARASGVEFESWVDVGPDGTFRANFPAHKRLVGGPAYPGMRWIQGMGDDALVLIQIPVWDEIYLASKGRGAAVLRRWDRVQEEFVELDAAAGASVEIVRDPTSDRVAVSIERTVPETIDAGESPPDGPGVAEEPVWFWFEECGMRPMEVELTLDGKPLFTATFPICRRERRAAPRASSKERRIVEFAFVPQRSIVWEGYLEQDNVTAAGQVVDVDLWQAGAEADGLLFGVTFSVGNTLYMNTLLAARADGEENSAEIEPGLRLTTRRVWTKR
jgi:hypothetical protein